MPNINMSQELIVVLIVLILLLTEISTVPSLQIRIYGQAAEHPTTNPTKNRAGPNY